MPLYQLSESLHSLLSLGVSPTSSTSNKLYRRLLTDEIAKLNFKYLITSFRYFLNSDKEQLITILERHSDMLAEKISAELDLVSSIYLC